MTKIFISYRRSDAVGMTGRIYDRLAARYGSEAIFLDVDNIPLGTDFREHIEEVLDRSAVLIAVIGPDWLGTRSAGEPRIFDETDPVRVEIQAALRRKMSIIPVLVADARMPADRHLPHPIREFAFRNALEIEAGRDFNAHVTQLMHALDGLLDKIDSSTGQSDYRLEQQANRQENNVTSESSNLFSTMRTGGVLISLILALLLSHYLIVMKWDLNPMYLRMATVLIPIPFGFYLALDKRSSLGRSLLLGAAAAIIAALAMSTVVGVFDGTSIIPASAVEWQEFLEYSVSIFLAFGVGGLLLRASRFLRMRGSH